MFLFHADARNVACRVFERLNTTNLVLSDGDIEDLPEGSYDVVEVMAAEAELCGPLPAFVRSDFINLPLMNTWPS